MLALGEYGGRLILSGDVERGMRMLREAGADGAVRPSWHHIYLFLGSYMRGDMTEASGLSGRGRSRPTTSRSARSRKALAAQAAGDRDRDRAGSSTG